ncbi:hypothetical protein EDEG_00973 [Edhazardia aedis USNM 41457]|uniref:Uncharacterized protein n=1 Tax=Edhazardia aedis (strain USNM 41457) TaxID=1003232 RepID=J9DAP7_EDHAE|nr:hypothetical protein EDEG_00973 [Edhazardia aedis USNM 41457]|eukprot:EJW04836.1 hypothetical protein EDEG_00973 [Edhazardia aedis USNM 41457]
MYFVYDEIKCFTIYKIHRFDCFMMHYQFINNKNIDKSCVNSILTHIFDVKMQPNLRSLVFFMTDVKKQNQDRRNFITSKGYGKFLRKFNTSNSINALKYIFGCISK